MGRYRKSDSYAARLAAGVAVVVLCASACTAGDAPRLTTQLGANQVYVGESVELRVQESNVKNPVAPDLAALQADFDVALIGDQSLNQTSIRIINFKRYEERTFGHIWAYRLTPKRAGTLTVPALSVTADGQAIASTPLALNVIAPEKQDSVRMELAIEPQKVYVGQSFDVKLRIYVRPLPDVPNRDPLVPLARAGQPPALQITWDNVPDGLVSDDTRQWLARHQSRSGAGFAINNRGADDAFAIFERRVALFDLSAGREKRKDDKGNIVEYFAYELKRTFLPQKAGTFSFGPATIKGTFVDGVSGRGYSGRAVYALCAPAAITVQLAPASRPPTFCGGIGSYTVSASATPTALRVGDPLTLTLAIEGRGRGGSLDLISAPDLAANAQLAQDFDIIDKAPTGESKGDTKRFTYGLRPKRAGVSLPPLTVTFFDPVKESFADVTTAAIPLTVTEAAQLKAGELVGNLAAPQTREIRSRQAGIFQNISDVSELGNQAVRPLFYISGVTGLAAAYGLLCLLVATHRRRAGDVAWQRRAGARAAAERSLHEARDAAAAGNKGEALRAFRASLAELIAAMLNLPAAGMTAQEAAAALQRAGVAEELRARAVSVLENIEALEYGSSGAQDWEKLHTAVSALLPQLQRALDGKR